MRLTIIALSALLGIACADNGTRPRTDTGGNADTGLMDGGLEDALPDAVADADPPMDAAPDAADTGMPMDAVADSVADTSMPIDSAADSIADATTDATDSAVPARLVIESAMLSMEDTSGVSVNELFYSGWRFEVPASGLDVDLVGFYGWMPAPGTLFAAVVQLSGPADQPDMADLSGADVIASALKDPGTVAFRSWIEIDFPLTVSLSAGWYAVVFGSNDFGADPMAGGNMQNMTGPRTPGAQGLFTLRQSDGRYIMQGGTKRIYVEGFVP